MSGSGNNDDRAAKYDSEWQNAQLQQEKQRFDADLKEHQARMDRYQKEMDRKNEQLKLDKELNEKRRTTFELENQKKREEIKRHRDEMSDVVTSDNARAPEILQNDTKPMPALESAERETDYGTSSQKNLNF